MNCDRVQDLLSEAIDGTLSPSESETFHAHVAACPPCRTALGELKESLTLLADLPSVEPREGFDEAVWTLIRAERRARSAGLRERVTRVLEELGAAGSWLQWAPLGVAAALLAWVMVWPTTPPRPDAAVALVETPGETVAPAPVASPSQGPALDRREYAGGTPQAIKDYLEGAGDGRDLSLPADNYRRSTWSYPFTSVSDPAAGSMIPVSGPPTTSFEAGTRVKGAGPGVPVLSF